MSDTLKPPPPPKPAPKPEPAPPERAPIENPKVGVGVTPKTPADRKYAEKMKEKLKEEVEKVVRENSGAGHVEQLKRAAEKARKDGGIIAESGKIKQIDVDVRGNVGSKKIDERTSVVPTPPASAPTPAPAEKKK
jgi:hypothetical protein